MTKPIISLTFTVAALLASCANYKMEIQQGNYLAQEQLASVQRGMGAEQVQAIWGTPLLQDDFRKDRWDYVFYLKDRSGKVQRSNVTVFFQNGVVQDIRSEAAPAPKQ